MEKAPTNNNEIAPNELRPDMSHIEHMPEDTLKQVITKKQAFNDHILKLDALIPQIHQGNESGENADQIDNANEAAQDGQDFMMLARDMDHARDEMNRLGDKEELLKEIA
jgi:hypothetical protein